MPTLAWFLAAARTRVGPPMSICSISSSSVDFLARGRLGERIEVDHHQLERIDGRRRQLLSMLRQAAVGQDSRGDARVKGLHPAVEHLGEAGDVGDVCYVDGLGAHGAGSAAGRDELEAKYRQRARERQSVRLVRYRNQGSSGWRRLQPRSASASFVATTRGSSRCSTAWTRARRVSSSSSAPIVSCFLGDDRPAVTCLVDDVDGHPGHACAGGQVRRGWRAARGTPAKGWGAR